MKSESIPSGSLILYVDGASRGNPGPAGIGVVICDSTGKPIAKVERQLSVSTNNVAEYQALILGLEEALVRKAGEVIVRSDSELIVRQSKGDYKIRAAHLKPLADQVRQLTRGFERVIFQRIPREENSEADRLARLASRGKKQSKAMSESGDR